MQSCLKSSFKKSAITLGILSFSVSTFAAMPSNITGFILGAEGLYFQPKNGDLDYLTAYPDDNAAPINTSALSPDYNWGYRIFAGLKFCNNDDLILTWWQLNGKHDDASLANPLPGFDPRWLGRDFWEDIYADVKNDLTDVSLVLGHTINLNTWTLRFAGGLEYTKIDSDFFIAAYYPFSPNDLQGTYGYDTTMQTRGIGPRAEFDANYYLTNYFSLFLNSNAALLVSKRHFSQDAINPEIVSNPAVGFKYDDRHVIVPKFGLRLGANFGYKFNCGPVLNLYAGWEADTFVHAIERPTGNIFSYGSNGEFFNARFTDTRVSNLTVQGPFVGVKVGW